MNPDPGHNKIVAIAHNVKAFDLHFILNRAIMLKWKPEIIANVLKIISMKMEHLVFLESVSFLPSMSTAQTARCFRSACCSIMVPALLQH